ncbi:hypothetical protein KDD30_21375 (plasmid) [Photobacterium sp. GJ3]|uniref:VanZ family protein n=1 Tax=Photobacterium sp. GJ3 TaxID=2829502 RepID=UPI001B8CAF09|nr:hypothetical protein [Photobacterium sp. GJ3]QUJ69325.1 hypothetical protein KDD30_21375 [Photobacterium sp. GJ3]
MGDSSMNPAYQWCHARSLLPLARGLFLLHALLITGLTLMPAAEPGSLTDLNSYDVTGLDALLHAGCYALLAMLALPVHKYIPHYIRLLFLLGLYGTMLEASQSFLQPGRESSLADGLANLAGIILGGWLSCALIQHRRSPSKRSGPDQSGKI